MSAAEKIVITGGPGTGKTAIIENLSERGFVCLPEVSRAVTLEARDQGIEQLFLEDAQLFSKKLLEKRVQQFYEAGEYAGKTVFLDRGVPDIVAYMDYIGTPSPDLFIEACKKHVYNKIFLLPLWEAIYTTDNERYENFEQAAVIDTHIRNTYAKYGYHYVEVPVGTVAQRADFILNTLK